MATNEDRIEVLLVEDNPSDAELLCEFLQDYPPQKFAIERAERLEEAIKLAAQRTFDVILLDLTLPDSTGLDTCARMRRAAPQVPIVVLTGVDDETIALEAMRQGIEDYLVKGQILHGSTVGRATRYAVERSRSKLALRESEEQFRATYEHAAIGIQMLSLDGRPFHSNGMLCRILGYSQHELEHRDFNDITHPEDLRREMPLLQDLLAGRIPSYTIEKRYLHKDGHSVWVRVTSSLARVAEPYRISIIEDITARKQAEEQLVKLNRVLKALSDSSHALLHAAEESAYLQEVCRIIVEDCGYAMVWIGYAEQDEARSVRPAAHAGFERGYLETLRITWADTERGRGPTGTAIRTGRPCLCRNMLTDPSFAPWREEAIKRGYASSIVLPLLSHGAITIYSQQPDPFSKDEVALLMELAADLAYGIGSLRLREAHARDEETLRASEARLRLALEGGRMGRWEWDVPRDTSLWDPRVYELLGLDPRVPAASRLLFQMVDSRDRDAVRRLVDEALAGGGDFHAEFRVGRPNGETAWLVSQGKVIRDERGQAIRMMGVMYDVTQRKQMEADLRRLNGQLEEEVQAQTEELKDTIDRLKKEMTRRVLAEGALRKRSQTLEQRARQLQKLTLELSRAEDRERKRLAEILHDDLQQQLAAAKFHLSLLSRRVPQDPALRKTVDQLDQILKDAIEKSRSLSHELSPAVLYQSDLGESFEWLARQLKAKHGLAVYVESRGRIDLPSEPLKMFLYKAAQEILFNVVKHARVKEVRLRVQRIHGRVWLTISDRGQGFDPGSLGRAGGVGLLSIRERIELLGGRMKIRSAPGRGSTFLIVVPDGEQGENVGNAERKKGRTDEVPPVLRAEVPPFSPCVPPSDHHLRVLLVDDHKVMREGLASLLKEQSDLEVVGQAGNGREAVDLAYRLGPDVVVMDAAMPLMAGDEATRQIRLHLPNVRVVALSMFEEADMAEAMRQAGAEAYLLKTAPSDELLAAIRGTRVPRV
jgi:PAS domain S-box-containing protein